MAKDKRDKERGPHQAEMGQEDQGTSQQFGRDYYEELGTEERTAQDSQNRGESQEEGGTNSTL